MSGSPHDDSDPYGINSQGHTVGGGPSLLNLKDRQIRHVYPTFGKEHTTNKRDACWCQPRVEFVENGAIIIHEVEQ